MGPRAFTLGNSGAPPHHRNPPQTFNGAEGFHPRKQRQAEIATTAYLAFNGAEGFHPRKLGQFRTLRRYMENAFNGAEGFHPRKPRVDALVRLVGQPSMGPRAFTLGNLLDPQPIAGAGYTFNGAEGFHPRKLGASSVPGRIGSAFNGAEGFHPRKPELQELGIIKRGILQWGRGLSPSETIGRPTD